MLQRATFTLTLPQTQEQQGKKAALARAQPARYAHQGEKITLHPPHTSGC